MTVRDVQYKKNTPPPKSVSLLIFSLNFFTSQHIKCERLGVSIQLTRLGIAHLQPILGEKSRSMSEIGEVRMDKDVDTLYALLREREEDLLLAGRFGKNLLEEKEGLKKKLNALQRDFTSLEEVNVTVNYRHK